MYYKTIGVPMVHFKEYVLLVIYR